MAVDHALLESVRQGGPPVLRLYTWSPACLSLGRNQHARGLYHTERLVAAGIGVVRRPTGGLAVLHDHELTYCVLAPAALLGGPRASYRRISQALVAGLLRLGVPAGIATAGPPRDPRTAAAQPCFQEPAEGEVVAAGRKLVGSAQRAEGGCILQHGSILLDGSQDRVAALVAADPVLAAPGPQRRRAAAASATGAITLREVLGAVPDTGVLADALIAGFETVCGIRLARGSLSRDEASRLPALEAHYEDPAWTWRR